MTMDIVTVDTHWTSQWPLEWRSGEITLYLRLNPSPLSDSETSYSMKIGFIFRRRIVMSECVTIHHGRVYAPFPQWTNVTRSYPTPEIVHQKSISLIGDRVSMRPQRRDSYPPFMPRPKSSLHRDSVTLVAAQSNVNDLVDFAFTLKDNAYGSNRKCLKWIVHLSPPLTARILPAMFWVRLDGIQIVSFYTENLEDILYTLQKQKDSYYLDRIYHFRVGFVDQSVPHSQPVLGPEIKLTSSCTSGEYQYWIILDP